MSFVGASACEAELSVTFDDAEDVLSFVGASACEAEPSDAFDDAAGVLLFSSGFEVIVILLFESAVDADSMLLVLSEDFSAFL